MDIMAQLMQAAQAAQAQNNLSTSVSSGCPGLNRVREPRRQWVVPHGKSADEETYCQECAKKYGVLGTSYRSRGGVNCDGYLRGSHIDNGIFGISFWVPTLKKFYDTNQDDDEKYHVKLDSGDSFMIFINANLQKNQYYRYTIKIGNMVLESPKGMYHKGSVLVNKWINVPSSQRSSKKAFYCIDTEQPGADLLFKDSPKMVAQSGTEIHFAFDIFTTVVRNIKGEAEQDYGSFRVTTSGKIVSKTGSVNRERIQLDYDAKTVTVYPYTKFAPFTKKPMEMVVVMDTNGPTARGHDIMKSALERKHKALRSRKEKLEANVAAGTGKIQTIQTALDVKKEHLEEVSNDVTMLDLLISDLHETTVEDPDIDGPEFSDEERNDEEGLNVPMPLPLPVPEGEEGGYLDVPLPASSSDEEDNDVVGSTMEEVD